MRVLWALIKLLIKEIFRKKDFYVALILIVVTLFYAAQLKFYNVERIARYLMELGLALIFFFSVFLTASLAARQYPSEVQQRTCHVLLAKPVTRVQFIFGKYLGSLFAGAACFLIFYVFFIGVVMTRAESLSALMAAETAYLFVLNLAVVAAMASGFSYYMTTAANVSTTVVVYFLISTYGQSLKEMSQNLFWISRSLGVGMYYLLPHFEFFDLRQNFIHRWDPVSAKLLAFLTCYAACYAALFLMIGWIKFRKEPIT